MASKIKQYIEEMKLSMIKNPGLYVNIDVCVWNMCQSYEDIQHTMISFIKGEIYRTPTHMGALVEKEPQYIDKLIKLNTLGAITEGGQQFENTYTINECHMQREYLIFAYKLKINETLESILDKIKNSDFFYQALDYNNNTYYQSDEIGLIDFKNPEFWVTRTKDLKTNTYENHTHLVCPEDIPTIFEEYQNIVEDFYDNVIIFEVWSKNWERNENGIYLLDKVIQCFV